MGRSEDEWAKGKCVRIMGNAFGGFFFFRFLNLILSPLGFCCYAQAFFSCSEWGLPYSCDVQASHRGAFSCCEGGALICEGFSNCSTWAQQLRYMGLVAP